MTDTITKTTLVNAPIDKVWRAVSDHREFGAWFRSTSTSRLSPASGRPAR